MTRASYDRCTDAELVQLARAMPDSASARQAAAALLGRYQGRVIQWCRRYVRDREEALDLAQDVLVNAYRHLGGFGERAQFSSWLFAIARNRCVSALRRPELLVDDDAEPEAMPSANPQPEEELIEREEEERLAELMRRHLDPLEQEALWLRCVERMPVDEITRVLGIEGSTGARAVLQSARRKLRVALERAHAAEAARNGRGPAE